MEFSKKEENYIIGRTSIYINKKYRPVHPDTFMDELKKTCEKNDIIRCLRVLDSIIPVNFGSIKLKK